MGRDWEIGINHQLFNRPSPEAQKIPIELRPVGQSTNAPVANTSSFNNS